MASGQSSDLRSQEDKELLYPGYKGGGEGERQVVARDKAGERRLEQQPDQTRRLGVPVCAPRPRARQSGPASSAGPSSAPLPREGSAGLTTDAGRQARSAAAARARPRPPSARPSCAPEQVRAVFLSVPCKRNIKLTRHPPPPRRRQQLLVARRVWKRDLTSPSERKESGEANGKNRRKNSAASPEA